MKLWAVFLLNRISLIIFVWVAMVINCFAIDGLTPQTAFTAVGMARNVTSAGTYYFNLNGQAFSTHVNGDGQLLIAIDFGNGSGNLASTGSLTNTARGIVTVAVLSELTNLTEVRITSSDGVLDVSTSTPEILNRIAANFQLNRGTVDESHQSGWTGTGQVYVTNNSPNCNSPGSYTTLSERIFHACGDSTSLAWMPKESYQRSVWNQGEIASTENLQLLVGAAPVSLSPALVVEKQADKTVNVAVGELITYTYTVTNTGGSELTNIKLVDNHNGFGTAPIPNPDTATLNDVSPSGDSTNTLAGDNDWDILGPGDSLTVTASYTVTQADLDNLQ